MEKKLPELNRQSPDTALLLHIQDRNPFAFELLYERYRRQAAAFFQRMLPDESQAASALKEAMLRVASKRDSYRRGTNVLTWLFRNLCHVCFEHLSRRKAAGAAVRAKPDQPEQAENGVRQAFEKLDQERRAMVIMQKYHGLSYNNIADVLGRKPSWVKWQMKLSYDLLGSELEKHLKPAAQKPGKPVPAKRKKRTSPGKPAGGL